MRTYLDHNATSPLRTEARRALLSALDAGAANASSIHAEGREARAMLDNARAEVAALASVTAREVVSTWAYPATGRPHGVWFSRRQLR